MPDTVTLDGKEFRFSSPIRLQLETTSAEVLAYDQENRPAFTLNRYGKGKIYFCAYPLELDAASKPGVISGAGAIPLADFYRKMALTNPAKTVISDPAAADAPYVGVTEHILPDGGRIAVLINYTPEERTVQLSTGGQRIADILRFTDAAVTETNGTVTVTLPANTGTALTLR